MTSLVLNASAKPRRVWKWVAAGIGLPVGAVMLAAWWFTEPLETLTLTSTPSAPNSSSANVADALKNASKIEKQQLRWPETRLEGEPAKKLLLEITRAAHTRMSFSPGYRAVFLKQERIRGKLLPEQRMVLKIRNSPFAIYLRFLDPPPERGKEVVYAEGKHDNKLIGHYGGLSRRLLPRIAVAPNNPVALADSRHPVTEAGLANLIRQLLRFRELDIGNPDAGTILEWQAEPDGSRLPKSIHTHARRDGLRPFCKVEIVYDPKTWLPIKIDGYDWPAEGDPGLPKLAERYRYEDLELDLEFDDIDFDPANPAYEFRRF
jgi:hypothetical protein